ncbi:MAG: hypothetical protein ACE10H_02730 [Candidatus Binatia bacterium]
MAQSLRRIYCKMIDKNGKSVSIRFSLARLAYWRRDVEFARAAHTHEHLEQSLCEEVTRGQHLADTNALHFARLLC